MEWVFHSEAEAEFIESAAHFEREVPGLGQRFGRAVKEALEIIVKHPEIGSRLNDELRSFVVAGFRIASFTHPTKARFLSWLLLTAGASLDTGALAISANKGFNRTPVSSAAVQRARDAGNRQESSVDTTRLPVWGSPGR